MIFQTLDDKNECVGYYLNKSLIFNSIIPSDLNKTWSYSAFLKQKNIDYAQLYCDGKTLEEVCPENLRIDYEYNKNKLKSVLNTCFETKIDLRQNCFFDLVPKKILIDYCEIKNKITNHVFENYQKPKEYDFYKNFTELLIDIKYRTLNIDLDNIKNKLYKDSALSFYKKISNINHYIDYNMFGSITGRLTVKKDSFPILTFPKQYRSILKPTNDWFISFDMNAAELRTAFALLGKEQPKNDFHEWTINSVYNGCLNRNLAKETTTSWLYNSNSELSKKFDKELNNLFNKEELKKKYWIDNKIYTPYNRVIESDEHHAISYLNQSTFIDLFHRQILKVNNYLSNKKSFVAFMIHDEFVLDMSNEEKEEIVNIINILQNTEYGTFPVNVKAGKNFGEMKKLNLKVEQCKQ